MHAVVRDWRACDLRPQLVRLVEHAEKITRNPASCCEDDIKALRAAGFCDTAIHDAVQVIAYFNYINRVADALGVKHEPDTPHWGPPESD